MTGSFQFALTQGLGCALTFLIAGLAVCQEPIFLPPTQKKHTISAEESKAIAARPNEPLAKSTCHV